MLQVPTVYMFRQAPIPFPHDGLSSFLPQTRPPQGGLEFGIKSQARLSPSQQFAADGPWCVHGPQGRTWGQYLTARLSSSSRLWLVPWAFSRPAAALQMDFLPGKTLRACS